MGWNTLSENNDQKGKHARGNGVLIISIAIFLISFGVGFFLLNILQFIGLPKETSSLVQNVVGILAVIGTVAYIGYSLVVAIREQRRKVRIDQEQVRLQALAELHPELLTLFELMNIQNRRSAFTGIMQNGIFYVLGVVTPILLSRLHIG